MSDYCDCGVNCWEWKGETKTICGNCSKTVKQCM